MRCGPTGRARRCAALGADVRLAAAGRARRRAHRDRRVGLSARCRRRRACDVDEFEALVGEAESLAARSGDRVLRRGAGAVAGTGVRRVHGRVVGVGRVDAARRAARSSPGSERAAALIAIGHHNRAVPDLEGARRRASAAGASGEPADAGPAGHRSPGRGAARVPRRSGPRLVDETGLDPSAELVRLERSIAGSVEAPADVGAGRPLRGYTIHEAIGEGAYGRVYCGDPAGHRAAGGDQGDPPGSGRLGGVHPPVRGRGPTRRPPRAPAHRPAVRLLARAGRRVPRVPVAWRGTAREAVISGGAWSLARGEPAGRGGRRRADRRPRRRGGPQRREGVATCCSTTTAAPT